MRRRRTLITSPLEWQLSAAPVSPPIIPVLAERGGKQLHTPRAVALIDSREQNPFDLTRFKGWFGGIEKRALPLGDYSIAGLEDVCVVERKDLADLVHSFTTERATFISRLRRMAECPHRLLVITVPLSQVKSRYPYSGVHPNQITQSLVALLAGLQVPFLCTETHELGEELVASYLYQVHLYHWLESNGHGKFLADNDLCGIASFVHVKKKSARTSFLTKRGGTLFLTATGYDSSGNVLGTLQSVIWNSSSPSTATVSNAAGSAGIVNALSTGTVTITASVGTIFASIPVTVTAPLVSIAVVPSNPTVVMGSTQALQLTATATYADGSSADVTQTVTWTSSNSAVATVLSIPGSPIIVVPTSAGNVNITAALSGISGSTTVVVVSPSSPAPPVVTLVYPQSGTVGTQITFTGSGFGATQGSGTVWLGSTLGTVVTWADNQVVASVATGSTSGVAQIQQNGIASIPQTFTVNTPTISYLSTSNGIPGTQVTINGSGFGATQGSGNVWLGTVPATVNTWSDGQVTATVATGAASGNAQILQNGVMSNAMPFTIDLPHISGINPNSGVAGAEITINGNGFGATQGSGSVWIGNTYGTVISWCDHLVKASVAAGAVSGVAKIQQSGTWSNAVTFTVPPAPGSNPVTLVPNVITLVVGETQSIQAVNSSGQSITGLTWTSSNTAIVTLSTDDPPIITAVGAGNATITAGNASADVTVYQGSLSQGTILWSNPGDGSGVSCMVPAYPASNGTDIDIFALQGDGSVQALTSDGMVVWTANVGVGACNNLIPDFQGGLVVATGQSIFKLDGVTGQPYPGYTSASGNTLSTPVVHTDGTIFTIDGGSVVGINPITGQANFSVQLESSTNTWSGGNDTCTCNSPVPGGGSTSSSLPTIGNLIMAGDGYAYVPYLYVNTASDGACDQNTCQSWGVQSDSYHLSLMRVGSGGDSSEIALGQWQDSWGGGVYPDGTLVPPGTRVSVGLPNLLINANLGVLASWQLQTGIGPNFDSLNTIFSLATTSGNGINSNAQGNSVPNQASPIQPILQRADGTFVGTVGTGPQPGQVTQTNMIAFNASGNVLWSVPNDSPQMVTTAGGVIGTSGTTYDTNGNVTGKMATVDTVSWPGHSYKLGSIDRFLQYMQPMAAVVGLFSFPTRGSLVQASHKNMAPNDLAEFESGIQSLRNHNYNDVADYLDQEVILHTSHENASETQSYAFSGELSLRDNFFRVPKDGVEVSVMLFHEYDHLAFNGPFAGTEFFAYTDTWEKKYSLGWTPQLYGPGGPLAFNRDGSILWDQYQTIVNCIYKYYSSHPNAISYNLHDACGT